MKEKSTERIAAALMGDLLVRLAGREKVKSMLGTLDETAAEELIPELVQGIEKTIEWHYLKFLLRMREKQGGPPSEEPALKLPDIPPFESRGSQAPTIPLPLPPLPVREPVVDTVERPHRPMTPEVAPAPPPAESRPFIAPPPVAPPPAPVERRPSKMPPPVAPPPAPVDIPPVIAPAPVAGVPAKPLPELPAVRTPAPPVQDLDEELSELMDQEEPEEVQLHHAPRQRVEFDDNDVLYLHGVCAAPLDENAETGAFMLEEKGIEDREFAFAYDFEGMRFYLSKLRELANTVSKGGMLLLNKTESLRLRKVHESIVNDLRMHDVLLPFEFGTVARGKAAFLSKIDKHRLDLQASLKELLCTTWWNLSVYALDAHMAQILGSEGPASRRERGAGRGGTSIPVPTKKFDVKLLDRILTREKKIAETVHEELAQVADRSDVDMMIGLGAGSSEDWKLILKASYEVPSGRLRSFNRAVTDLQYQHLQAELMFSLTGAQDNFAFPKKP